MTLFQYMSDIHLEFFSLDIKLCDNPVFNEFFKSFEVKAPYLLLNGDIGSPLTSHYEEFLDLVSYMFEMVFIIPGNHEYYNIFNNETKVFTQITMDEIDAKIEKIVSSLTNKNVHFLNNKTFTINEEGKRKIKIIGSILWSNIVPSKRIIVRTYMNDYSRIRISSGLFTPDHVTDFHVKNVDFIEKEINNTESDTDVVVMTHHLPTYLLITDKYKFNIMNCAYASKLDHLFNIFMGNDGKTRKNSIVRAWVCGHSHGQKIIDYQPFTSIDDKQEPFGKKIKLGLNPRGYQMETGLEQTGFDVNATFEV